MTLLELAKKQAESGRKLSLSAFEMNTMYRSAWPFLARLREDQKAQVRKIAQTLGLQTVASLI